MRQTTRWLALLLTLMMLFGCDAPSSQTDGAPVSENRSSAAPQENPTANPTPRENFTPYQSPPMALSVFHSELAEGGSGVSIDLSAVADGYVGVSAQSESRLKFQVIKDELTYTYNIASDGTPSIFPLQCGNGQYTFRVMENVGGTKYAMLYAVDRDVTLTDEFQPFLRPSDYSNYTAESACVNRAKELASGCSDNLEVVSAIYSFICRNIRYDVAKATTVGTGYIPNVDATLKSGMGICFDYASLAAAMLRSQGIPTKIIFGYVAPDDLYHAWNMFYTEKSGWVAVQFAVSDRSWNRIDLTFSANGADAAFIGDGSNYSDLYLY